MANRCIVHTANPVQVDQPAHLHLCFEILKRGDAFLKASPAPAQVVPVPDIHGGIAGVVPSAFFEIGFVTVDHKTLAGHFGVVRHGER